MTTDDGLHNYFRQFGPIMSSEIIKDVVTNESRGFGFVVFDTEEVRESVLKQDGHKLDGHTLMIKAAVPKYKMRQKTRNRGRSTSRSPARLPNKIFVNGLNDL